MTTRSEIANAAAVLIGTEARVLSLDDDKVLARTIKAVWDSERRAAIRDGAWNFAMRRAELPAEFLEAGAPYPWENSFPLPERCLRLIEVLECAASGAYQLEGGKILANHAGPLHIRYLVDVPEPGDWDAIAAEAFAHRLAWKCGRKIAGSNFDTQGAEAAYRRVIARAKTVDALENPRIEASESDWILARHGYAERSGGDGWGDAW